MWTAQEVAEELIEAVKAEIKKIFQVEIKEKVMTKVKGFREETETKRMDLEANTKTYSKNSISWR